jgi:hypothetical protein
MATPAYEVGQLQRLLAHAPTQVKEALGIEADGSFHIMVALIEGVAS